MELCKTCAYKHVPDWMQPCAGCFPANGSSGYEDEGDANKQIIEAVDTDRQEGNG